MKVFRFLIPLFALACSSPQISLTAVDSGTDALLIGISPVNDEVVWISGTNATICFSENGGDSWETHQYLEGDTLQFRDIYGIDESQAIVMSAGPGSLSNIFLFSRESEEWTHLYQVDDERGFLDAIDFWDERTGLAYGDALDGYSFILKTTDGGNTWQKVRRQAAMKAVPGEGGFAASGTCLTTGQDGQAWIGTAGSTQGNVLFTSDYGETWERLITPMQGGEASGITSVRFVNEKTGMITGGSLLADSLHQSNVFYTTDAGASWQEAKGTHITPGAFYGGAFQLVDDKLLTLVSGPKGVDVSFNQGKSWKNLSQENIWSIEMNSSGLGWMAGRGGKLYKLQYLP